MKNRVVVFIFTDKGKYLFEKRWDDEDNYAGLWSFPGGHIHHKEKVEAALRREVKEELHIKLHPIDDKFIGTFEDVDLTSKNKYRFYAYLCKDHKKTIKTYEQEKIAWFTLAQAEKKKLPKHTKDIIKHIKKLKR